MSVARKQRDSKATGKCPPVYPIRSSAEFEAFQAEALSVPVTPFGADEHAIFLMRCLRADRVATELAQDSDDRALLRAVAELLLFMVDERDEMRPCTETRP